MKRAGAAIIADRRRILVVALLPAAVGALVFANTLPNGLIYDDPNALEVARSPLADLATRRFGLTYLTIRLDQLVWGSWAPGFHLSNVIYHCAASALAALAARALGASALAALVCGLVFAVHPVHVEAVASIENRKDVLAMCLAMASLVLYRTGRSRDWRYVAALACFALAMHAKEVAAIGLAVMLPLADLLSRPTDAGSWRLRARRAAGRAAPVLIVGVLATGWYAGNLAEKFSRQSIASETDGVAIGYGQVVATSAGAVPDVARLLFFPATLSADYPKRRQEGLTDRRARLGMILMWSWMVTAVALLHRAPLASFAMAWTVVMYLPLSNIVPLTPFFVAERYLYVPSFGVCLLLGLAVAGACGALVRGRAPRWLQALPVAIALVLIVAGGTRSMARNRDWRDALTLWTAALRAVPEGSGKIHGELGHALWQSGHADQAIPHLRRAIEIGPEEADFHNNLGLALLHQGRSSEAVVHFSRALDIWPVSPLLRFNVGRTLWEAGERQAAIATVRQLTEEGAWQDLSPTEAAALSKRGMSSAELRSIIRKWVAAYEAAGQP